MLEAVTDPSVEFFTVATLKSVLASPELLERTLVTLGLPPTLSSEDLFFFLDEHGLGVLSRLDFVLNAMRMVSSTARPVDTSCLVQLGIHRILCRLRKLDDSATTGRVARNGLQRRSSDESPEHSSCGEAQCAR